MTPANKKAIDPDELKAYFLDNHTLGDCAAKWGCAETTIKRHLRSIGVDTSIYNHTTIAFDRRHKKYNLSDEELRHLFIDRNLDTKTIGEMCDPPVHYNVIRKHTQRLKLRKDRKSVARSMSARHIRKHGQRHPSQRPDVIAKTRRSTTKAEYCDRRGVNHTFRSLHELGYALLLDSLGLEWYYEEMVVPYVDAFMGKWRSYTIDFTVVSPDGSVAWVEVKPNNKMIPDDKRLYASRRAEESGVVYRGLSDEEREKARVALSGSLAGVKFVHRRPRQSAMKVTYYFLSEGAANKHTVPGWRETALRQIGNNLWARTFVRR